LLFGRALLSQKGQTGRFQRKSYPAYDVFDSKAASFQLEASRIAKDAK
jgi:hypothetical protein